MSDDFNRKLEAYEKGELTGQELAEFEEELAKLESYYESLANTEEEQQKSAPTNKWQQKIVRKGKWKARLQTAFTALGIFLIFSFLSALLTAAYYSWGNPNKASEFGEVIDYTLTITDPYGYLGRTSTSTNAYFGLEATRDISKQIGKEVVKVGDMEVNFLFSSMGYPEQKSIGSESQNPPFFTHSGSTESGQSDWNKLEKLPEGTVVSAYVSFTELLESKDVEQLFSNKEMDLLWLAVDTGLETKENFVMFNYIGFPSYPIWHEDDMIVESYTEEAGLFGSKIISESASSPAYHEGDQDMLHEQFLKTLYFLQDHEKKANRLVFDQLYLEERINYLEKNGIRHYGAVITGPTKEVLKLQDETLIEELQVDEVEFWNW